MEKMNMSYKLDNFPVSFFSAVMGMAGFTIAVEKAESLYGLGEMTSSILSSFTMVLFLVLLVIYLFKIVKHTDAVKKELHHPIKISFFPTVSISLLLLSICMLPKNMMLANLLWSTGTILHLGFTLYVMNAWINHDHLEVHHMNPAWFIPIVGNILVPIAGVPLGYGEISWFFFSIATMVMYEVTHKTFYSIMGTGLLILLTLFISMLIFMTIKAVMKNQICVEE